ncbi:MAG: cell division protein ZapA [Smithellaceae bacterium]|nr:cell division protein ZapA [Smithellaceae bacterium]
MNKSFDIQILGQEISVRSDSGDEHAAMVIDYVSKKVEEIGKATGQEDSLKVAILVALNIADDYLKLKGTKEDICSQLEKRSETLLSLMNES